MNKIIITVFFPLLFCSSNYAFSISTCLLNDPQIAQIIVNISLNKQQSQYCLCPNDRTINGGRCAQFSQWSKSGGTAPKCFLSDVSAQEILDFRNGPCLSTDFCCQTHGGSCGCIGSEKYSEIICCDGTLSSICTMCLTPQTGIPQGRN